MKYAVFSMDVEDWYHLDYFDKNSCNQEYSMLDGINQYCEILDKNQITSTFFVISEIAHLIKDCLKQLNKSSHEIGSHGSNHIRPMEITVKNFYNDICKSKKDMEDLLGHSIEGYRAPCFSLDRERLDQVKKAGFLSTISIGILSFPSKLDIILPNTFT